MTETTVKWIAQFPKDSEFTVFTLPDGEIIYEENKTGFVHIPIENTQTIYSRSQLIYAAILGLQDELKEKQSQLKDTAFLFQSGDHSVETDLYFLNTQIKNIQKQIKKYEKLL